MGNFILRIMINALSIAIAVKIVNGIAFSGEWWKMIVIGGIFGVVNALIKPIVTFFTFPLIVLTLGLFTLIVNTLMLLLTAELSVPFDLNLHISGFWAAFKGALIVSIVSMLLSWLTGIKRVKYYRGSGE